VERLTDKLRANPGDHAVTLELASALTRLGRDLDLLALLSARIEEGDDGVRRDLTPLRRDALLRLAAHARAEGRASEAELYEMMSQVPDE
jgi:cellulose synthase operon protein C